MDDLLQDKLEQSKDTDAINETNGTLDISERERERERERETDKGRVGERERQTDRDRVGKRWIVGDEKERKTEKTERNTF